MKRVLGYFLVFILAIIGFAVMTAPSHLLKYGEKFYQKSVSIERFSGKVIAGSVKNVVPNANLFSRLNLPFSKQLIKVKQLDWQIDFSKLLQAKIGTELQLTLNPRLWQNIITSKVYYHLDKTITAQNIQTKTKLKPLLTLVKQAPIASGDMVINLEKIVLKSGEIDALTGNIKINNFILFEQNIGKILATISLSDDKKQLLIKLTSSKTAKIKLDGLVKLGLDKTYKVSIKLSPNQNASTDLVDMLSLVGYASGKNRIVNLQGKL